MILRLVQLFVLVLTFALGSCGLFGSRYDVDSVDGKVETLGQKTDQWKKEQRNAKPDALAMNSISSDAANSQEGLLKGSDIADVYREAYELIDDPITKNHILQRLAAIDLKTAENLDIVGVTESQEAYQVAIDAYTELLNAENQALSEETNRDELLYALSKAYALRGNRDSAFVQLDKLVNEFPLSEFWLEAQFRRGEYLFVENRFDDSTQAFQDILARENQSADSILVRENTELFSNARYMAGWSEFKNSQYENAVQHFVRLLDDYVAELGQGGITNDKVFAESYVLGAKAFEQDNKVVQDALRAISLSLAYAPVEESLVSLEKQLGSKVYAHWVYAEIGELFFKQERLSDSARIYGEYERVKPKSMLAPWFLNQKIATLQHSGFKNEAWEEKAGFANRYHPKADYYQALMVQQENEQVDEPTAEHSTRKSATQTYVDDRIGVYLDELASFHHAKGRVLAAKSQLSLDSIKALDLASYWYRQKISAFPQDPEIANTYYLLAESLQEADHLPDAIQAYEYAAYSGASNVGGVEAIAFDKANEAGYAAILVYTTHIDRLEKSAISATQLADSEQVQTELSDWRDKKIESALLFSDEFPLDQRRDLVLANTVKDLQLQEQWVQVIEVADKLLLGDTGVEVVSIAVADIGGSGLDQSIEPKLALPTWLASAGAAFTLKNFGDAESRYASAINMMQTANVYSAEQQRYLTDMRNRELQTTIDNYASSIYSQAEQANAVGEKNKAIEQFQRLVAVAPTSQLRVAAQRDAIVLMAETEQWQSVKQAVPQFVSDFPSHQDNLDMQRRLLNANVQLKDWTAASTLASSIANDLDLNRGLGSRGSVDTDTEVLRRQEAIDLRFASADYAINSGDKSLAITRYEDLIRHSSVIDESLYETHFRLASLYADTKNRGQELSQYRLIKQLEPDDAKRTDRSLYIVAHAESELAELDFASYQGLKIQQPLLESLKRKQAALDVSVAAYTRVENYAVEKYALLATQRKAQIYADFAKAIMDSDRPTGLDDLALEEYEILLEEQAYPFEEQAIEIYEVNVKRAWQGSKSSAIGESYKALAELLPARYGKSEILD